MGVYIKHVLFSFDDKETHVHVCLQEKGDEVRPDIFKWFYKQYGNRSALAIMKEWRKQAPMFLQWIQQKPTLPGLYTEIKDVPKHIDISTLSHSKDLPKLLNINRRDTPNPFDHSYHMGNLEQTLEQIKEK
jgi:hypothetical protein